VPDNFHHSALVLELLKFFLFNDLSFNFLDRHDSVLPASAMDNTVPSFGQFVVEMQLSVRNLRVLHKRSGFIAEELFGRLQCLSEFTFQVFWICTGLLKLQENLALVFGEHPQSCLFIFIKLVVIVLPRLILGRPWIQD
jgi:hypothetical protein